MKKKHVVKLLGYSRESKAREDSSSGDFLKTLKEERAQKTDILDSLVKKLTEQMLTSIKYYNGLGKTECVEEIPVMILGFPLYNVKEVAIRVSSVLNKMKFKTKVVKDNMIYICWKS